MGGLVEQSLRRSVVGGWVSYKVVVNRIGTVECKTKWCFKKETKGLSICRRQSRPFFFFPFFSLEVDDEIWVARPTSQCPRLGQDRPQTAVIAVGLVGTLSQSRSLSLYSKPCPLVRHASMRCVASGT